MYRLSLTKLQISGCFSCFGLPSVSEKNTVMRLKSRYYYNELKQIGLILAAAILVGLVYNYGAAITGAVWNNTGMLCTLFLMVSVVLGQVIRLFYQTMMIKYTGKGK